MVEGSHLFRKHKDGIYRRVIMSSNMVMNVLESLHDSVCGGHFGIENTL